MNQPKSLPVAVFPGDEHEYVIRREGHMYTLPPRHGGCGEYARCVGHQVQYMEDVRRYIEEIGGHLERRPNPSYRPPKLPIFSALMEPATRKAKK